MGMDEFDTRPGLLDRGFPLIPVSEEVPLQTVGWHRHRWTTWDEPVAIPSVMSALGGIDSAYQDRRCVRCKMAQRRRVFRKEL